MSMTSDFLLKVIEGLPTTLSAEIIDGEIIVTARTPPL